MKTPILLSNRLILKTLNKDFLSQKYVDWMNDPEVIKYLSSGGDYTIKILEKFLKQIDKNTTLFWAITLKKNNKHIGNIKIDSFDKVNFHCEYGIMMGDKSEWGKGYAKEASKIVIEYCFNNFKLRKINLGVLESNLAALNLYNKLNFKMEAKLIDHVFHRKKFENVIRMAIFNNNFDL